jgi:hypothetical protein
MNVKNFVLHVRDKVQICLISGGAAIQFSETGRLTLDDRGPARQPWRA